MTNLLPRSCSIQKNLKKGIEWCTCMKCETVKKLISVKLAVCSFYAFKRHLLSTDILIKRKWLSENNSFTHHFISFVLMFNRLTSPTDIDSSNCENYSQNDEVIVYNKPFTNGQGCLAPLFKELQISLETKADIWYIYTTS